MCRPTAKQQDQQLFHQKTPHTPQCWSQRREICETEHALWHFTAPALLQERLPRFVSLMLIHFGTQLTSLLSSLHMVKLVTWSTAPFPAFFPHSPYAASFFFFVFKDDHCWGCRSANCSQCKALFTHQRALFRSSALAFCCCPQFTGCPVRQYSMPRHPATKCIQRRESRPTKTAHRQAVQTATACESRQKFM